MAALEPGNDVAFDETRWSYLKFGPLAAEDNFQQVMSEVDELSYLDVRQIGASAVAAAAGALLAGPFAPFGAALGGALGYYAVSPSSLHGKRAVRLSGDALRTMGLNTGTEEEFPLPLPSPLPLGSQPPPREGILQGTAEAEAVEESSGPSAAEQEFTKKYCTIAGPDKQVTVEMFENEKHRKQQFRVIFKFFFRAYSCPSAHYSMKLISLACLPFFCLHPAPSPPPGTLRGYSSAFLTRHDPPRYSAGKSVSPAPGQGVIMLRDAEPILPDGWKWLDESWRIDTDYIDTDLGGWTYARTWKRFALYVKRGHGHAWARPRDKLRRRRWLRLVRHATTSGKPADENGEEYDVSVDDNDTGDSCSEGARSESINDDIDYTPPFNFDEDHRRRRVLELSVSLKHSEEQLLQELQNLRKTKKERDQLLVYEQALNRKRIRETETRLALELSNDHDCSEHIQLLEEQLNILVLEKEDILRRLLFPECMLRIGGNGVYVGLQDVLLERVSGDVTFCLSPSTGRLDVNVTRCAGDPAGGASHGLVIKLWACQIKLRADHGTGLPNLNLSRVQLQMKAQVMISATFDKDVGRWGMEAFDVTVSEFRGPFNLGQKTASTIIRFLKPSLERTIKSKLSTELGHCVICLQEPLRCVILFYCATGRFAPDVSTFSEPPLMFR